MKLKDLMKELACYDKESEVMVCKDDDSVPPFPEHYHIMEISETTAWTPNDHMYNIVNLVIKNKAFEENDA